MKKTLSILAPVFFLFLFPFTTLAHSGRTDSSGGHNCSSKSIAKGLCTGYHYHNSGSYTAPAYIAPVATVKPPTPEPSTPSPKPTEMPSPTPSSEPEVKGESIEQTPEPTPSPSPEPLTAGETVTALSTTGGVAWVGWKFLKWLGKKAIS